MTPSTHPVWPGGPPCRPTCPGPSSTFHRGYADGYEAGAKDPMVGLADAVEAVKGARRTPIADDPLLRGVLARALEQVPLAGLGYKAADGTLVVSVIVTGAADAILRALANDPAVVEAIDEAMFMEPGSSEAMAAVLFGETDG